MDESALLRPVHQRKIEFLKEKRNNSCHTDFLQRLEERIELIKFETLTKESLLSHIFLEESDYEIQRITTKLLAKNLRRQLRTPTGTDQGVGVELVEQDKKEVVGELEEEDGALTVAVELIILHFVGEKVCSAINLAIKPPNAGITLIARSCLVLEG